MAAWKRSGHQPLLRLTRQQIKPFRNQVEDFAMPHTDTRYRDKLEQGRPIAVQQAKRFAQLRLVCRLLLTVIAGMMPLGAMPDAMSSEHLPGTGLYVDQGDLAERTLDGIARFLHQRTADSIAARSAQWNRDRNTAGAYAASIQGTR